MKGMIDSSPFFKPGDPKPDGYLVRQEWAAVQLKAGLRQVRCGFCSHYCFPQELSGEEIRTQATTSRGLKVNQVWPICKECRKLRKD
jgi:hypothetical protein